MKSILIPTEDHRTMNAVLETARLFASRFDCCMEGVAVHPATAAFIAVEPVSSLTIPAVDDAQIATEARQLFESFMRSHGVPAASDEALARYSFRWAGTSAEDDAFVGSHGRLFDLIVLGRPGPSPQDPRMAPLETALFESGHPVLIAPRSAPQLIGENVLVAWNGSTEQARTNTFALPLLRQAREVTVLSVEGAMTPGPSGAEVAQALRWHGIKATAASATPCAGTPGETILAQARALGCDLLVKGAYTQSRLRQIIFGGATRHILAHAELPVFMAH
jgi:nucleotide-binding universal stress UspA family protein